MDGVAKHSQLLTHITKNAKRHQRTLVVSLIDLRNAFGAVPHKLIYRTLLYHHVPVNLLRIIGDIYTDTYVKVAHKNETTPDLPVLRGLLQGDPCSPLLFNMCFNILMVTVSTPKYEQYGYLWGPNTSLHRTS